MKHLFPLFLVIISSFGLLAQTDTVTAPPVVDYSPRRTPVMLEFDLGMGFPAGHFRSEIDRGVLFGKSISLLLQMRDFPLEIGFRFAGFSYDHVRRRYDSGNYVQVTKNKIWLWRGIFRFEQQLRHPIAFYLEGTLGWRRYYTKTYSKETGFLVFLSDREDNTRFDKRKLHSEWGPAYGGAIGIRYRFREETASGAFIQVGYDHSRAGDFYARTGNLPEQEDPLSNYTRNHAALSMLTVKIGLFAHIGTYPKKSNK
ncbi:MAG: hypothetical protein EP344_09990 [Bacteroidetes bacterium]|nr:MAG: hypothetical protein EP344_09990 [Bacteroidota bacterium]